MDIDDLIKKVTAAKSSIVYRDAVNMCMSAELANATMRTGADPDAMMSDDALMLKLFIELKPMVIQNFTEQIDDLIAGLRERINDKAPS